MIADKRIFCFWFGSPMNSNRKRCLDSIISNSNTSVELITEDNLENYIISKYPLHEGFQYLSATHKSDYLRSYFMYFYGGGYTDIKQCDFSWTPYFDQLNQSEKMFIGASEINSHDIGDPEVSMYYKELVVCTQFIFKKNTHFAKIWFERTQLKMNQIFESLKLNPGTYHPRAVYKKGVAGEKGWPKSNYPLRWSELLGKIFHRLQYENKDTFLNSMPYPNIENYR